jgi:hypothetical protein
MLYSATPTGMRILAGDYREADIRRAQARRADRPAATTGTGAPVKRAVHLGSASRIARLITILPHAR